MSVTLGLVNLGQFQNKAMGQPFLLTGTMQWGGGGGGG